MLRLCRRGDASTTASLRDRRSHDTLRVMDSRTEGERRGGAGFEEAGGDAFDASNGTSRTRHENTRSPSLNTCVSGKEENAILSFSSLLIPSGGYIHSTSGPSSKSKCTQAIDSIQRCRAPRASSDRGSGWTESSERVSCVMSASSRGADDMIVAPRRSEGTNVGP